MVGKWRHLTDKSRKSFSRGVHAKAKKRFIVNHLSRIRHKGMVSGFFKQTVERQGSLVFCVSKTPKSTHTVGEKGRLGPAWRDRGG